MARLLSAFFPFWTVAKVELQGLSDLLLLLPKWGIKRAMYSFFRSIKTLKLEKMPMQIVGDMLCQSNHEKNYFTNNWGCFLFCPCSVDHNSLQLFSLGYSPMALGHPTSRVQSVVIFNFNLQHLHEGGSSGPWYHLVIGFPKNRVEP